MIDLSRISRFSHLGRALRAPLSWVPHGIVVPVLQGPLRGHKWVVGSSVHGCWLGMYEAAKQRQMVAHIRPGDVVWDIGANVGFYSLLAAVLVGDSGRVHAFEPAPLHLGYLHEHLRLNPKATIEVHELALASEPGTLRFAAGEGMSSGKLSPDGELEVPVATIDTLIDEGLAGPDVIKMDIEGAELGALQGAARCLADRRPRLFLATHGDEVHRGCVALLRGKGYELRGIDGSPVDATDELVAIPRHA